MKVISIALVTLWVLMTIGMWSTYYFHTPYSPIFYPLTGLGFLIFVILGAAE